MNSSGNPAIAPALLKAEKLTKHESTFMTGHGPITTITWMRGDVETASSILATNFESVLKANPWLGGKLKRNGKDLVLEFLDDSHASSSIEISNILFNPTKRNGKSSAPPVINSMMDYNTLCNAVAHTSAEILKGSSCINKDEALVALSVVPDSRSKDTFAVIFSVSHVIVDGFNYYQLLSMLSNNGTIRALSAKRKHEIIVQGCHAMGLEESALSHSKSIMCNVICSMICGKKALAKSYFIDMDQINQAKVDEAKMAKRVGDDFFVSTNDIVTSTFGNCTSARILLMAINLRNRLPAFQDTDAGNYERALVFCPHDYDTPSKIRKTLQSGPPVFLRGGGSGEALPGSAQTMRCRLAMITNWAFPVFTELALDGCQQILHLPHINVNIVPFDLAIIYRPNKGMTAVTYFMRSVDVEGLKSECPVGEEIVCAGQLNC